MSQWNKKDLRKAFENWRRDRAPTASDGEAFERFGLELVLQDFHLSDGQITFGQTGGQDDGGVDGLYLFLDGHLVEEVPTEVLSRKPSLELHIVQCHMGAGFKEATVQKLADFMQDLLDLKTPPPLYLNPDVVDAMRLFHDTVDKVRGSRYHLAFVLHYCTMSVTPPGKKVQEREDKLVASIAREMTSADVRFTYWGATELLKAIREPPEFHGYLPVTKQLIGDRGEYVALARVRDFADFISTEEGELRRSLLESNVRAYLGKGRQVNRAIRSTLEGGDEQIGDFWWFNNGVTMLATKCSLGARGLEITDPQIVNGLQTSTVIHEYVRSDQHQDARSVLVRVIVVDDETVRTKIIRATNNQTAVDNISLHSFDPVHFAIEEHLLDEGLYYERRKGHYRQMKKPVANIVSMSDLAKASLAIFLQRPNDARARSGSTVDKDDVRTQLYDASYDRDFYVSCVLLDRAVNERLKTHPSKASRTDLRYYVDMVVACDLTATPKPTVDQIAAIAPKVRGKMDPSLVDRAIETVLPHYQRLGGDSKVARGPELAKELRGVVSKMYGS